jgi:superfamily II DNA or RNA helicase
LVPTQVPFSRTELEHWADALALRLGTACFKQGGVGSPTVSAPEPGRLRIAARVVDGAVVPRTTVIEWDGARLASRCDCPMGNACKHAVALTLAYLDRPIAPPEPLSTPAGRAYRPGQEVILYGLYPAPPPKKLEGLYRRAQTLWLSMDMARLKDDGTPGATRPLQLWGSAHGKGYSDEDVAILELVTPFFQEHGRDFSSAHARGIPLLDPQVTPVLTLLRDSPFVFGAGRRPIEIRPDRPVRLRRLASWQGDDGVWELDGTLLKPIPGRIVGEAPAWVLIEDTLHPLEGSELTVPVEPVALEASQAIAPGITHPPTKPVAHLTLHESGDSLLARLTFLYGSAGPVSPADPRPRVGADFAGQWGFYDRDPEAESDLLKRMAATELEARGEGEYLGWGDAALGFLLDDVPGLIRDGWQVFGEDHLKTLRVDRRHTSVSLSLRSGTDWFDLETEVRIEGQALSGADLRQAMRSGSRFVRLGSGAFAKLPEEWLSRQRELAGSLGFELTAEGDRVRQRLPQYQVLAIADLLETVDTGETPPDFQALVAHLKDFSGVPEEAIPEGFRGELRGYQRRGLDMLCFWRDHGLNGILADDMGLGKTIQAIALLLTDKQAGRTGPTLLVAPTSVVYNWEQELARFALDLKTLVLHGSMRHERFLDVQQADVVLTSYPLLRRDFALLQQHTYRYVILDEAQMIKNPRSQSAKAACALKAHHRLCLTGTPIENNLIELWSLFHFLMPGYLGTEKRFRLSYLNPGPMGHDPERAVALRRRTRPFILRRLKQEVATDLPPRSEMVSFCDLSPDHRRFYDALLAQVRSEVIGTVDRVGLSKAHFNVLEGLLRLRQACCDPQLVAPHLTHLASSKVDHFLELIQEIIAGEHRVLVFSQFVKVLKVLERRLHGLSIPTEYLDGQTKDRLEKVEAFNSGTTPVFLISLKAGGTGLNLTGADYVIHFDPWWNPAVEDQATDRAHRIGQTRHVFSYKLIARNTIEEKVLALQARKRDMVRDVLGGDEIGRSLTREDLEFLFS